MNASSLASQSGGAAIVCFILFLAISLGATYWAARRTRSNDDFLAAGRRVSATQNGLALTGDFLAATGFLGSAGLVALTGFDGLIYSVAGMVGWPLMLFLLAEPLRNLGRYTFADVLSFRLRSDAIRIPSAVASLCFVCMFLVLQMVGAGSLVRLLFGIPYSWAVVITGAIMLIYVLFGGMLATTLVQIIKCVLLMGSGIAMALMVLSHFGFSVLSVFQAAADSRGPAILGPGAGVPSPIEFLSLGLSTALGVASYPHVLMRFYTVPDARTARRSVLFASGLIGLNMLVIFVLGFAAMSMIGPDAIRAADRGGNMTIPLLAAALGGTAFMGFVAAVAFATILAAVCGLVISGVGALSHDIWTSLIRGGNATPREQLLVAKISTVLIAIFGVVVGLAFEGQNIAYMTGLASSIAASASFPALVLAIFWSRFTSQGAIAGMLTGLVTSIGAMALSPFVQIDLLHHATALFPLRNPGIVTIPLAFFVSVGVSLMTSSPLQDQRFADDERRMLLGARHA